MTAQPRAHRRARRIAWLAVVALVVAAFAPNVLALTGAIYTSNFDGSIINANTNYAAKADVYLTGGPCGGGSHLPDGDYYFQVTSPNGSLLSTDAIEEREFAMSGGFIASAQGHATNPVNCSPPVTGVTVQLIPFADTPNNGNEYKLHVATRESVEACPLFVETSSTFVFCNGADQKSDNFKVGADPVTPSPVVTPTPTPVVTPTPTPVVTPTPTPVVTPTPTPVVTPTPTPVVTPTGGVGGATGTPAGSVDPTLPPTSTLDGGSGGTGDSWRVVLLAMAGILAAALLLTPARVVVRKDDIAR